MALSQVETEDRKCEEYREKHRVQAKTAQQWPPHVAAAKAVEDVTAYAHCRDLKDETRLYGLGEDMGAFTSNNRLYREALEAAAPDVAAAVAAQKKREHSVSGAQLRDKTFRRQHTLEHWEKRYGCQASAGE
jgi:hypothetical protein